jgi:D,D-heptose 1,7-bisphosphate phosphatase
VSARAVFLDKDGTLVEDVPYNVDPAKVRLTPGATEGLRLLHQNGYRILVISNQSGVARGYFAEEALAAVEGRLRELLAEAGVPLDGFYYCPHYPQGVVAAFAIDCECRKPRPGLILRAAHEHGIDLTQSWFIGDSLKDVEAGLAAGCLTVLLGEDHETAPFPTSVRGYAYRAATIDEAARLIVN